MAIDKIVCVGKNYLEHAKELGDAVPEKPVLFLKPASVLRQAEYWGEHIEVEYPTQDSVVQPECEIVFRIDQDGYQMTYDAASKAITAVTLGLDMTLRARQTGLKKQGHPWTTAKVFKDAAIVGPWIALSEFKDYMQTPFQLTLDGYVKQSAKGLDMMMHPVDLLVYISQFFPLKAGDIIFTGTPAGVTSIAQGTIARLEWLDYSYQVKWS